MSICSTGNVDPLLISKESPLRMFLASTQPFPDTQIGCSSEVVMDSFEKVKSQLGKLLSAIIADAGYGGEEKKPTHRQI
ncbi:hypothetical protein [Paenibacillus sp. SYP-B3998]|uniref:hypothetical protein n=1 Tax=Paenibacillus sp. SYP-B3998 TaxID=2678564 RepID=UPI001F074E6E|nr:hypothetical protein [Paenibacillus sp. SYP-B3998]